MASHAGTPSIESDGPATIRRQASLPGALQKLTRRDVYRYLTTMKDKYPAYYAAAMRWYTFPMYDARLEGVFSYLTDMAKKTRLKLGPVPMSNELLLRSNRRFVTDMMIIACSYVPAVSFISGGNNMARPDSFSSSAARASAGAAQPAAPATLTRTPTARRCLTNRTRMHEGRVQVRAWRPGISLLLLSPSVAAMIDTIINLKCFCYLLAQSSKDRGSAGSEPHWQRG